MITSSIIHHLGGQAGNMLWGHLSEMLLYRPSEATTFVNTCRLVLTGSEVSMVVVEIGATYSTH